MSVSWVFVRNKIEFQYVSDQKKIFIFDIKADKALSTYSLPDESKELDKDNFISLCLHIRGQIDKGRRSNKIWFGSILQLGQILGSSKAIIPPFVLILVKDIYIVLSM